MTEKKAISLISKAILIMTDEQTKEFYSGFSAADKLLFLEKANKKAVKKLLNAHEIN